MPLTLPAQRLSVLVAYWNRPREAKTVKLARIAGGDCGRDDCPTMFTTDRGTIAVQGNTLDTKTREGESVVEIPEAVLREAIRALGW